MTTLRLPYTSPPLRSNDRLHWRAKAAVVRSIRDAACVVGRQARPQLPAPIDYPVTVTMVWEVADRRVRDVGSMAPTCKAAIDGLVDAGVLASDRHSIVTEERYRIEVGTSKGVRVEIDAVNGDEDAPSRPLAAPLADPGVNQVGGPVGNVRGANRPLRGAATHDLTECPCPGCTERRLGADEAGEP